MGGLCCGVWGSRHSEAESEINAWNIAVLRTTIVSAALNESEVRGMISSVMGYTSRVVDIFISLTWLEGWWLEMHVFRRINNCHHVINVISEVPACSRCEIFYGCCLLRGTVRMDRPGRFWSAREESETSGNCVDQSSDSDSVKHAPLRFGTCATLVLTRAYSIPLSDVYSSSEVHSHCFGSACSAYVAVPLSCI